MNKSYIITTMQLGPMDNFIYIITDIKTQQAAVIDPAWDGAKYYPISPRQANPAQ